MSNVSIGLADLRDRINKLKGEIAALQSTPISRDEAAERLTAWVESTAAEFDADRLIESAAVTGGDVNEAPFGVEARPLPDGIGFAGTVAPALCWLSGDTVKERLLRRLDEVAGTVCSDKSDDQRRKALDKAHKQLWRLEVDEEAEIVRLESAGVSIVRRRDCRPEIVLAPPEEAA